MDWKDPKILIGGGVLAFGLVYLLFRQPSAASDDGPTLLSYVPPGGPNAIIDGAASGSVTTPTTTTAESLANAQRYSDDTYLSAVNTESLLANVQGLVTSQLNKLPFASQYGFTSNIRGGLTLSAAGSPQFNIETTVAPRDPSNAQAQISRLTAARDRLTTNLTAARDKAEELAARLRARRPTVVGTRTPTITGPTLGPRQPVTTFPRP